MVKPNRICVDEAFAARKKWLMIVGFSEEIADEACNAIRRTGGQLDLTEEVAECQAAVELVEYLKTYNPA